LVPSAGKDRYYGQLERAVKAIALRVKLLSALESLLRLADLFLIVLLGGLFLPRATEVFPYLPFVYYLLTLLLLIWVFLVGVWRTASRLSAQRVARGLEETFPGLRDDVTNSLLLFREFRGAPGSDEISEGLITAHLQKTADEVSKIRPHHVASFKRVWPQVKLFLPLFLTFALVIALDPPFLNRSLASLLHPFSVLPERETFLSVKPAEAVVLRGTPVVIRAEATGYIPDRLQLRLWSEKGKVNSLEMKSEEKGRFSHLIPSAQGSFRYQVWSGKTHSPVYDVRVVDAPDIGEIKLTLLPPGYTGLPSAVKEEGHFEALKGTVVNLEARATKAVVEGKLILNQKDQLLLNVEGDRLQGSLLVLYPGTYSLSVKDELGFENAHPVQYRIRLIPDKYPEVEILSPTEDLEVSGTEVLNLTYAAKDDFGISSIRLIYEVAGKERSIPLKSLKDRRSTGPELFKWDLASLALTAGDRVTYRLEVWDNDSISGPKAGHSRTFALLLRDEKDRTARESERAQEVADALLDLLADHLEEIKDRRALSDEIVRIMEKVDRQLESMGKEKLERFDLESLKRNLAAVHRRIDDLPRETITQEIERLALLADDLARKTRMHEVEALAREIRNRQNRLIDALRDHKGPLTPEALRELLKEVGKLRDLINQVMEALSRVATRLPDEFINSPELRGMDFQDLFKELEEIQKKLTAGDLAGALEAAQNLLKNLTEMMAAMARAGAQASMGSFGRLQSEMSRQSSELEKILTEQKEVLSATDSIDRELKRLMEEETEKRLKRMMSSLQEILEQLRRRLSSEEGEPVPEMEELLKEKQIERFSQIAKGLQKDRGENPEVQKLLEELVKRLEGLTPGQSEVITAESKEKFPGLNSRQEKLRGRTRELGEKLERLSQLFPGMDRSIINDLKDAAGAMGRASQKLEGEDAPGAIPPEQEAIQSLTRSQQAVQQMAQQMARQMAMGTQANLWGYPWGYDPRAGWYYGPWSPMPTLPQPELRRPREQGYTGIDREEFQPPSKDAYKVPQILREKVMDALKEDIPSRYRQEVERYFKGLTE
jgi:flagellin-specific chaperone FliS